MKRALPTIVIVAGAAISMARAADSFPNAQAEGWSSEAFAEKASAALKSLAAQIVAGEEITSDATCSALRPSTGFNTLRPATPPFVVRRWDRNTARKEGLTTLAPALGNLRSAFGADGPARAEFKLFGVAGNTTRQYFSASGPSADGLLEIEATWNIKWNAEGTVIEEVWLEAHEETLATKRKSPLFTDVTDAVLPRDPEIRRQYLHGTDYWRQRIEVFNRMFKFAYCGLAIGDADGDGLDDLFSCQNGGLPNRLFLQNKDGTLRDATARSGLGILDATQGALFLDLDNDGDQDLVATTPSAVVFYENTGGAKFVARLRSRVAENGYSLAAIDYDGNGFLDIYVCRYQADKKKGAQLAVPVPYFNANNGGANYLIRNRGPGEGVWLKLDDATAEAGLDAKNSRFSFAAVWDDLDSDGDFDLYVANDFGRNVCYLNGLVPDGVARFREVAMASGLKDGGFGMSVTTADFNRDGRRDLYVGNMFSAAGNRVTRQSKFRPGDDDDLKAEFQRMARGNSLYLGRKDGLGFDDISVASGTTMGRWSWSSIAADINNDGWEDLLVANGYVTGPQPDDL